MRAWYSWPVLLGTLALAGLPVPTAAQALGSEFQINTNTAFNQATDSKDWVAADASGNFVVVWHSNHYDGYGIFAQRYDSGGMAVGDEFQVNSYTTSSQFAPVVASDADGNFVVAWRDQRFSGLPIFAQRFDSEGLPQGGEFQVTRREKARWPSVASDLSGNVVFAWADAARGRLNVYAERYDSAGAALGDEFRVNSYTTSDQNRPSVATDGSGNFVVVWDSRDQDGSGYGIFGQRYDSGGVRQGGEFRVNSFTTSTQSYPSVATDGSGNFVVVWNSLYQDGSYWGVFGQRYNSLGETLGTEFRVNSYTNGSQVSPSVAFDASGSFVVVWESYQDGSAFGIFGQHYDPSGVAQGDEFQINTYTSDHQFDPTVEATGTNQFVVAWTSNGQDGSAYGLFGQRLGFDTGRAAASAETRR